MARANIDGAINAIYHAALYPADWSGTLEQIADYVGGNGSMIVHNDIRNARGAIVVGRLRDDLSTLYLERHCANPLVIKVAEHGRIGQAVLGSRFLDHAAVRRTEFHADILAPQAIVDQVLLPHRGLSPEGSSGGFAVTLTTRQADDAAGAVERLARLGPHLSQAFDLSLEIGRYQDEIGRLGALLDLMPAAAMLLDRAGLITRANSAADTLLSHGKGLASSIGPILKAVVAEDDRRFRKAVAGALAFGAGQVEERFEQALLLRRLAGDPALLVTLTPLPRASLRMLDVTDARAALLVRVFDPTQELVRRERPLREAYELTSAETRVAVLIAQGLSVPAIAAKLGISSNTVRTHLARIYDKTGTHSQVSLASLVSAIGPAVDRR